MGLVNPALAAPVNSNFKLLIEETIDNDPTNSVSDYFFIGDKRKVAFLIKTVETADSDDSSVIFTVDVSVTNVVGDRDNTTIQSDILLTDAGTDGPVSSVSYSSSSRDTVYLPQDFTAQYARLIMTGSSTDATDFYTVDVWVTWQQ